MIEAYKNSALSTEERVEDLLSKMTLEEKVAQLSCLMPHQLFGSESTADDEQMAVHLKHGLGRITQSAMTFFDSPVQVAKYTNQVQKFALEKTRLGIPVLFQNESLNGATAIKATCFPSPINLASAWNDQSVEKMSEIISAEMSAMGLHIGLAPVLDVARDPRWGRVYETFGEDPYLIAKLGSAYVKGFQKRKKTLACAKHFLAYSVSEGGINMAAIHAGKRELVDIHAMPFYAAIKDAGLEIIMITYSEIDGVPISISKEIIQDLLRKEMHYDGSVLCDGGSISFCVTKQKVARDFKEAAIMAIETGLDAETPTSHCYAHLVEAVNQNEVDIAYIDRSVKNNLKEKFELGLFENPFVDEQKPLQIVNQPSSALLSKELATESIILLKNENQLLPLSKKTKSIALIGPHANNLRNMFTGYSFLPASQEMFMHLYNNLSSKGITLEGIIQAVTDPLSSDYLQMFFSFDKNMRAIDEIIREQYPNIKTLKEAFECQFPESNILFEKGCGLIDGTQEEINLAVETAKKADVIVVALGEKCGWVDARVGEGKDTTTLELPGKQLELLKALKTLNKPIIVTLFHGRPLAIGWLKDNVDAILDCGYPGQEGSSAIAEIIAGEATPGGKLAVTIPQSAGQIPMYYSQKIGSGLKKHWNPEGKSSALNLIYKEGYIDGANSPVYPFGYGLSYTSFSYSDMKIESNDLSTNGNICVSCVIKNTGETSGSEVAQLYFYDKEAKVTRPVMQLIGFQKVKLEPGQSCEIAFDVDAEQFCFMNQNYELVVEPGKMDIMIGSDSENIHLYQEITLEGAESVIVERKNFFSKTEVKF